MISEIKGSEVSIEEVAKKLRSFYTNEGRWDEGVWGHSEKDSDKIEEMIDTILIAANAKGV